MYRVFEEWVGIGEIGPASTWFRYVVLLARAKKWEGEGIDKEEKLNKASIKLNEYAKRLT